jgi:actin-related protein 6
MVFSDLTYKYYFTKNAQEAAAYKYLFDQRQQQVAGVGQVNSASSSNSSKCCCVVDSGYSFSHVVPTINGKMIATSVRRLNVGGKLLTNHLKEIVSYRQWNMMSETFLMNDVKEKLSYVSSNFTRELENASKVRERDHVFARNYILPDFVTRFVGEVEEVAGNSAARAVVLPSDEEEQMEIDLQENQQLNDSSDDGDDDDDSDDEMDLEKEEREKNFQRLLEKKRLQEEERGRQVLRIGVERFTVPEVLFTPTDVGVNQGGISETIVDSIMACEICCRSEMFGNIVLIGGNVAMPGFKERVELEVRERAPVEYDVKVVLGGGVEGCGTYAYEGGKLWYLNEREDIGKSFCERDMYLQ